MTTRNRDTLVVTGALMIAAMVADRMSPRVRAPERDATRLLGSPSILLPSLRFEAATESAWPLDLLYEPHRHPAGLVFARMVRLTAGRYEITLTTNNTQVGTAPTLVVTDHRTQKSTRPFMQALAKGDTATFTVDAAGEFDLSLMGGGPQSFSTARIALVR